MKLTKKLRKQHVLRDRKWEKEISAKTGKITMAAVYKVLRDEFGFGGKRLIRFNDSLLQQLECMADGYVKPDEIIEMVKQETGFDWGNM